MTQPFSNNFKEGLWEAFYEYFIITIPIGIYVFLEADHKNDWSFIYKSPEWAIATIFLAFIGINRYTSTLNNIGKKLSKSKIGIFQLVILLIIISAIYNAKISIESESIMSIIFRLILFILSSIIFFIFIVGKNLLKKEKDV